MKNKIKKRDIFLAALIVIICILLGFYFISSRKTGKVVRISNNNQVIEEISLGDNTERTYRDGDEINILRIQDGKADVISANCPNQVCVNTPPVDEAGETIACLPHGLIIEVVEQ